MSIKIMGVFVGNPNCNDFTIEDVDGCHGMYFPVPEPTFANGLPPWPYRPDEDRKVKRDYYERTAFARDRDRRNEHGDPLPTAFIFTFRRREC